MDSEQIQAPQEETVDPSDHLSVEKIYLIKNWNFYDKRHCTVRRINFDLISPEGDRARNEPHFSDGGSVQCSAMLECEGLRCTWSSSRNSICVPMFLHNRQVEQRGESDAETWGQTSVQLGFRSRQNITFKTHTQTHKQLAERWRSDEFLTESLRYLFMESVILVRNKRPILCSISKLPCSWNSVQNKSVYLIGSRYRRKDRMTSITATLNSVAVSVEFWRHALHW